MDRNVIVVPSRMGRLNKRILLTRLQRLGVASRADLAKSLGMSQPTAGKIADELLELGVLQEVDEANLERRWSRARAARLGRPARMLRLDRVTPRFLAIQLGVAETSLAALPMDVGGDDCWAETVPTPESAAAWVKQLRLAARRLPARGCWGVLVSVPGIVDETAGRVLFSPNLHWTERVDLAALIREVWDLPVALVQEERALALGYQASVPAAEDFLLVDFGEGVGGAVVVAGKLYSGALPVNGELGHSPVQGNDRRCGCGAVGCLETLVSTRGLRLSLAAASGEPARSLAALTRRLSEQGVEPWLAATLDAAGSAIAGALNVLGLRRVVVTGTLTELPAGVLEHLRAAILKGALWARFGEVSVEAAPRRRAAGLVAVGIDHFVVPMTEPAAPAPRVPDPVSAHG